MTPIEIAYKLLTVDADRVEAGGLVAMWDPDQSEPESHVCVYKNVGEDVDGDATHISIHLQRKYRATPKVIERNYWQRAGITPSLTDDNGPVGEFVA